MSGKWAAPVCAAMLLTTGAPAWAKHAKPPKPVEPAPAAAIAIDPNAADRALILARLHDLVGGMITRDAAAMEKVLSSDFQTITYGGRLVDRTGDIAAVTASPVFEVKSVTTSEVDIRIYGDAAVVRALATVIERRGDKVEAVPIRITQTWIRQSGDWRAVADQATRVEHAQPWTPPAAPAAPATVGAASPDR